MKKSSFLFRVLCCIGALLLVMLVFVEYHYNKQKRNVIDTDELQIVIANKKIEEHTAKIQFLITAKKMDSVLYDCGWTDVSLNNFRFASVTNGSLFDNAVKTTVSYKYCDTEPISKNQMYVLIEVDSIDDYSNNPYSIEFQKFGIYKRNSAGENAVGITSIYEGPWLITIDL